MYPQTFADLLKDWLANAQHPGIATVQTCADVGWHEQPVGVMVTLSDGWRFVLQLVGSYPPRGTEGHNPDSPRPQPFPGNWADRDDYRQARRRFEAEAAGHRGAKPNRPQAAATTLLNWIGQVVELRQHPELSSVAVGPSSAGGRNIIRVVCDDGSVINCLPVGFIPPGATAIAGGAHVMPAQYV